jgi:hypothetical protein
MPAERIQFPTPYPIKVVVRAQPGLKERIDGIFALHFGPRAPDGVSQRHSAQGHFLSLTYVPRVEAEAQLRALHAELSALEGVMMVI